VTGRARSTARWPTSRLKPGEVEMPEQRGAELDSASRPDAIDVSLRHVIETIPALVLSACPDGSVDFVNRRWVDFTGLEAKTLLGQGWQKVLHPDDLDRFVEEWRVARAAGEPFENEARVRRADGEYRWFRLRKAPLRDETGVVVRWYGTGHDIEDLKQAKAGLRLVIDTTPAMLHSARPDGYLDYFNQRWLEYLGVPLESVCGWQWTNFIHPDDLELILSKWRSSLVSGEPFEAEIRVKRADGEYRWMLHQKGPLRDRAGNIVRWYGSSVDIDDRKQAEFYLAEGQRLAHTGSWAFNAAGFAYWSPELFRIYGLEPGGKAPTIAEYVALVHPDDRDFVAHEIRTMLATDRGSDFTKRIVRPDGAIRHVRCVGMPAISGRTFQGFVGTGIDVTEQEQLTKALRESEAELQQILDFAPQLVGVFGPKGERLYANRVALAYHGLSLEEWRQRGIGSEAHPDDSERLKAFVDHTLSQGFPCELELRLHNGSDGSYRWFLLRYNPVHDDQGQIVRWFVACTDIEERKTAADQLQKENVALREEIDQTSMFEEIVGVSAPLREVLAQVTRVAPTDSTVLISGETGTGKELVARAIHKKSGRSNRALVSVNCAAIPPSLIASELFGHEKGAFTGALQRRQGRFELADGGTIFLDEVSELPAETQIALLRVLQEREFERVGNSRPIRTDVRVIAASNRDLEEAVARGEFRADLFYRLNVFPLEVPALRDRREDIPLLVEYFTHRYSRRMGKRIQRIDKSSLEILRSCDWPGNVRELQNVVERAVILCEGDTLTIDDTWLQSGVCRGAARNPRRSTESETKEAIERALTDSGGRVAGPRGAAARLGVPRSTLESRIRSLNIRKHTFKDR
jgi:PAS domain S-box-containing protein